MNFNILIFGPSSAGKTTWLNKIVNKKYNDKYSCTSNVNVITIKHNDVQFLCEDIPSHMTTHYIDNINKNVDCIFLMCEVTGENLDEIAKIKTKLNNHFCYKNTKSILIIN